MKVLVFILFVAAALLVKCEDNVAMESDVQQTYKLLPRIRVVENSDHAAQIAQATRHIAALGKNAGTSLKESSGGKQNQIYDNRHGYRTTNAEYVRDGSGVRYPQGAVVRHEVTEETAMPENYRRDAVAGSESQQIPQQQYLVQQVPVHQIQTYGSQTLQLHQGTENNLNGRASGFTSYVEHLSEKDNSEELQSAVKEGSLNDIKRLVPKSGITFKMYHPEKSGAVHKTTQITAPHYAQSQQQKLRVPQNAALQFKIEVPETQVRQTATSSLDAAKVAYLNSQINGLRESPKYGYQVSNNANQIQQPPKAQYSQLVGQHISETGYSTVQPKYGVKQEKYKSKDYQLGVNAIRTQHQKPEEAMQYIKYSVSRPETATTGGAVQYTDYSVNRPEAPTPEEAVHYAKYSFNKPETPTQEEQLKLVSSPAETFHIQQSSYVDVDVPKNSQTFDHQKALEGSTMFDIKNAIGNTNQGSGSYELPTSQVQYTASQAPTAAPLVSNIHNNLQEQNFIHETVTAAPDYSHLNNGKFLHQPQTLWQGNSFGNFHHQPVTLHLPKEEVQQLVKTSENLQKTPEQFYQVYQESPFARYPQIIHYPLKLQTYHFQQQNHQKFPPNNIDFTLHKSKFPILNTIMIKPELMPFVQEPGKKIIPILVKKRKNRSSKDVNVVMGRPIGGRGPIKPSLRNDKTVRMNVHADGSHPDRKNEFSVSASYKVDRSLNSVDST